MDPLVLPGDSYGSEKAVDDPVICFVDEEIIEASLAAFNGKLHSDRMREHSDDWILV